MKIAIAQTQAHIGDVSVNIEVHQQMIKNAIDASAKCIFFPELSLTGYEPKLAKKLALSVNAELFDDFQSLSNNGDITIGLGAPIRKEEGICIAMVFLQPYRKIQFCFKEFLHVDEEPYFIPGDHLVHINVKNIKIGLAICYEISVAKHIDNVFSEKPKILIASVAKFKTAIKSSHDVLGNIAKTYKTPVVMANCIGVADGEECGGSSAVWDQNGAMLARLAESSEGLLVFDMDANKIESQE